METAVVKSPKIDTRDSDAIVQQARALATVYTPEWNAAEDTGAGAALLKIVARLLEGIIRRLNDVPLKLFIAFLDSIGVKLLPALPARAPLTFFLSAGAKEAVVIPARSQVAAKPPEGGDPVIFETEKAILATPAKMQAIISVVPAADEIIDHIALLASGVITELFSENEANLQSHVLYLAHDDLFNVKSEVSFKVKFAPPVNLTDASRLAWEYCAGEKDVVVAGVKQKTLDWRGFDRVGFSAQMVELTKTNNSEIKQVKVNGLNSRWIRCRTTKKLLKSDALAGVKVQGVKITATPPAASPVTAGQVAAGGINPDAAFYNDFPLAVPASAEKPLTPFGPQPISNPDGSIAGVRPRQGDVFYLASQDAFSKRGAAITLTIEADAPNAAPAGTTRRIPNLSWEYWNGAGWVGIPDFKDKTGALTTTGDATFVCPEDIALTSVIGQENFWIRARIGFGDYGQEKVTFTTAGQPAGTSKVVIDVSNIRPPVITSLKIGYIAAGSDPQYSLTLNNLEYSAQSPPFSDIKAAFSPFIGLDDDDQSLYIGFDQAPVKGPISIFFSLQEQEYTEENLPRIEWQYFRRRKGQSAGDWSRLIALDGTRNLTQSGTIEFIGPPDFASASRFGKTLFWIRAVDGENKFRSKPKAAPPVGRVILPRPVLLPDERGIALSASSSFVDETARVVVVRPEPVAPPKAAALAPCDQAIESLTALVKFPVPPSATPQAPLVKGVYLNTAWAVEAETIQDELVGSSQGGANQAFKLARTPVIEESIWIDELSALTETERNAFSEQKGFEVRVRKDAEDNVIEFLVRWRAIDDLGEADATDRVYTIDRTFGTVQFGDGAKHGMAPPIGKDNIKATYSAGGGSRGNVAATLIKSLRSTIPLVESASNPEPAGGGSDTEPIQKALERGPQVLKNRGRAITAEDFEWLAKEASQAVARAKCLSDFNDRGQYETGWVTVLIVPLTNDERPLPSPQLRQRVEAYLLSRSVNVASFPRHVKVIPPAYVAVKVLADIYPVSLDVAPQVESEAIKTLQTFLHPLNGGYNNSGWDFGRLPCLSDFYALLEAVEGVDHIDNLSLELRATTPLGEFTGAPVVVSEDRPLDVGAPAFTLVYSGEHKVTIQSPTALLG